MRALGLALDLSLTGIPAGGGGRALPLSASLSTFAVAPFAFDADGVAEADVDLTALDTAGDPIVGLSGTVVAEEALVSAADSTVVANPSTIADDGVESSVLTVRVVDEDGYGVRGIPAANVVLSLVSGTGTLTQPTGFTNYDGVITGSLVSGTAGTCVVRATVLGLALDQEPAVEVTGTPGLIDPLFASDFRTSLGTSDAAKRDTSGITAPLVWVTSSLTNEVVENVGLGFPEAPSGPANALRLPATTAGINRVTGLGVQEVGATRAYRALVIFSQEYPSTDVQQHPIQDGNPGSQINWELTTLNSGSVGSTATLLRVGIQVAAQDSASITYWHGPLITRGAAYYLDWTVTYDTNTTFRITSINWSAAADETPLWDASDYTGGGYGGYPAMTLEEFNASYTFAAFDRANSDGLNFGVNDPDPDYGTNYGYQTAIAVADNQGRIGAYGTVQGES